MKHIVIARAVVETLCVETPLEAISCFEEIASQRTLAMTAKEETKHEEANLYSYR